MPFSALRVSTIRRGPLHQRLVIERRMVGDDDHAIGVGGGVFGRGRFEAQAVQAQRGHVRVAVGDDAAAAAASSSITSSAGDSRMIVDIALVSHAHDVNARALDRLAGVVQRILHLVHHEVRHLAVDVARPVR